MFKPTKTDLNNLLAIDRELGLRLEASFYEKENGTILVDLTTANDAGEKIALAEDLSVVEAYWYIRGYGQAKMNDEGE